MIMMLFVLLMIFSWLIVFVGNTYFIFIVQFQKIKIYYSILYLFGYYQFSFILSMDEYYKNNNNYFVNKINYISGIFLLGINSYIFSIIDIYFKIF